MTAPTNASKSNSDPNLKDISAAPFARWLPFLAWPRPDAALLRADIGAGLAVGLVIVPQSVAYAALAGMPLVTGLYAALLPAMIAALFSASSRLSVGPSALTALLVSASLAGLAQPVSAHWVSLAVWLAILTGLVQLVVGLARATWVLNLISAPVLMAFTQAAVLLIVASQLPALIGLTGPLAGLLDRSALDLVAMTFGLGTVAVMLACKWLVPRAPTVMLVVVATALLSWLSGYSATGLVVGALPAGLPDGYWPMLPDWHSLPTLLASALVIALVSSLETASSAKIEARFSGTRWNANQDMIGQGLAKLASALSGSFVTSTSFSRSAIALYAGGRSGWSVVASTVFVLATLLFFTPALQHVPRAVLAAIVIVAVVGLLQPMAFVQLWRIDRVEAAIAAVTFLVTLVSAPRIHWGVLTGVVLCLAQFLYHRLHPRIIELSLHPDGSLRARSQWNLPALGSELYALRMDAELDFASANAFERALVDHLAANPQVVDVCLFAQPINRVDATGVDVLRQIAADLAARGITLHICGLKLPVQAALERAQLIGSAGNIRLYRTDAEALAILIKPRP